MSFSPTFPRYINFNTASYIEPSSSIGPTGIDTLLSNQEWIYHNVNSQVLVNSKNFSKSYEFQITAATDQINQPIFIKKIGPLKLNLNKIGLPQPMFIAFKGGVLSLVGSTQGYFTFVFNSNGKNDFTNGWLNLTSSIQNTVPTYFQTLSGAYTDNEGGDQAIAFSSTSSVTSPPVQNLSILKSNTNKSSFVNDASQLACMTNISVYYTVISASSTASIAYPHIDGLYVREVNPYV